MDVITVFVAVNTCREYKRDVWFDGVHRIAGTFVVGGQMSLVAMTTVRFVR